MNRFAERFLLTLLFVSVTIVGWHALTSERIEWTFTFDANKVNYKINQIAVVGDFSNWQKWYYLQDEDHDGVWEITLPLRPGQHTYRFFINNKIWMKDPQVRDYTGPFSNSRIFVLNRPIPRLLKSEPATGSWLYQQKEKITLFFDRPLENWQIEVLLDSTVTEFSVHGNKVNVALPFLTEGEHLFLVTMRDPQTGQLALQKELLFLVNLKNQKPEAEAGATQFTRLNQKVRLNSGLSYDNDFEPLAYHWKQLRGPVKVNLKNSNSPFPEFKPSRAGHYIFELTVKDSSGAADTDKTDVWVFPEVEDSALFSVTIKDQKIKKVALVGEFNSWNPSKNLMRYDSLKKRWWTRVRLAPGQWEYKYVLNDTFWVPDPENPHRVADGWNGFNSIRTIKPNRIFEGQFVEQLVVKNNWLRIAFKRSFPADTVKTIWFSDVNNPVNRVIVKNGALEFNKSWPQGRYFYYLFLKSPTRRSSVKILLIDNRKKVQWFDFSKSPAWADTAIVYELYVRKFGVSGTFREVVKRLKDLKKMGINTLWLMPVYEGPTEHGYAPTSLFKVEKDYGTLQDYQQLIKEAHNLGMRVIFDFVANHLSDQHRFVRAASENPDSPLRKWFYWKPDGTYGYHNDWDTLVNLNFNSPWVRHYILNAALFWLNLGVDGFRCDVAWAIPHDFWKDFRRVIKTVNPNCLLVDEVLPRKPEFHDFEFDMSYDTDFYGNVLDVLNNKKPLSALPFGLKKSETNYPEGSLALRYLENHDLPRFVRLFGLKRARLLNALLFTVTGTPLIYYGQEYAMQEMRPLLKANKKSKWFDFFQKLIKFKTKEPALKWGRLKTVAIDDEQKIWWFRRIAGRDSLDVIFNFSETKKEINKLKKYTIIELGQKETKRVRTTLQIKGLDFKIIRKDGDR